MRYKHLEDKKEFHDPTDQGVYQLEKNVIAIIFGMVLARLIWKLLVPMLQVKSPEGIAGMLLLSGLLIVIGMVLYMEWIYHVGRKGWIPRIVVNSIAVLSFWILYFH